MHIYTFVRVDNTFNTPLRPLTERPRSQNYDKTKVFKVLSSRIYLFL